MSDSDEVFRQNRFRLLLALFALVVGVTATLLAVNLALQWPLWVLVVIVSAVFVVAMALLLRSPIEVRVSPGRLLYSGGIPPRRLVVTWDQVTEVRKWYEPGAFASGPVLSAVALVARSGQQIKVGRDVEGLSTVAERIDSFTLDRLLQPVTRSLDSGASVAFGPVTVSRATGVKYSALLQKHSISMAELSSWTVESMAGLAGASGPMLVISGTEKRASRSRWPISPISTCYLPHWST